MPTTLPQPRQQPVSKKRKFLLAALTVAFVLIFRSYADAGIVFDTQGGTQFERDLGNMDHERAHCNNTEQRVGYYGFEHCKYHKNFYTKLTKPLSKSSCCSGNECRVTYALRDAPPEFKNDGFDKMVFVDGEWYPIRFSEKQTFLPNTELLALQHNPLFLAFSKETHVCASRFGGMSADLRSNPVTFRQYLISQSDSYIYCVVDGGEKT